jgi:DNA polymerase-3 subunit alpha
MRHVFREVPEACDNTLAIAEMCDLRLVYGSSAPAEERFHVPRFEPPEGMDRDAYLRRLVQEGAERYGVVTPASRAGRPRARRDYEHGLLRLPIVWD